MSLTEKCQLRALFELMAPLVAEARATYPAARERFLAGLPPQHTMFVTTRLMGARPDGSEDGNVIGKFLDTYH